MVLLLAVGVVTLLAMSTHTELNVSPVTVVGIATPVTVRLANPHGVRSVEALLEQDGKRYPLFEEKSPAHRLLWKRHEAARRVTFEAGKNKVPDLKEGKARLVVEAVSNDLGGSTDSASADVNVVLSAPRVMADGLQHYINQGGMELVTITPGGSWSEAGVHVGKYSFRSFPLPGHPDQRFCHVRLSVGPAGRCHARGLRCATWRARKPRRNSGSSCSPRNSARAIFPIDDALMEKLVNSVDPNNTHGAGEGSAGPLPIYQRRAAPQEQSAALRFAIEDRREDSVERAVPPLGQGRGQLRRRAHLHQPRQQNRPAGPPGVRPFGHHEHAGEGRQRRPVVWAADLGIYGNCIVVDHGYGLQSIYGHLREIDVKVGDAVQKGQKMGMEGQTGLAGGTHLHFSMQVDGVQVNPREWWDEHWIQDRVMSKLAPDTPKRRSAEKTAAQAAPPHKKAKRHKK